MSNAALSWARDVVTGSPSRKAVLTWLADRYNDDQRAAWPSVATLSRCTELSERQVRRCLRDLEAVGLIRPVGWAGDRPDRMTRRYRLMLDPSETGGHGDTPQASRGDRQSIRGDTLSITGGHGDSRTLSEPLENPGPDREIATEGLAVARAALGRTSPKRHTA